ncbi:TetR/AcrR family transcriptional regulator [Streptomyces spirodelae]|uniref:TetR/AcrR family transcriptional regulator n=1 Tax=Streptomyces spirodelae TaxID=2812904 RepID=A0ABS3WM70_9ACTN|nr:TetR/AcrR family transcriptional regulator [Streptomyces spirodelae]MBO8184219.1 TetR/AcrR family transcriptional regulator [Streptomyces spirodelae]
MAGKKQFDMDTALDAAMIQFWRDGYADTSLDDLSRATGLNRSSIYSSLGDKDTLFLRCLDRYAARYGEKYEAALSCAASEPVAAVRAFFDVTLERIADPELPDGCLIAQSVMAIPALSPSVAAHAEQKLGFQRERLRAALKAGRLTDQDGEAFAVHAAAVNQSLAVMSRAGASPAELLAVVGVTVDALSQAVRA